MLSFYKTLTHRVCLAMNRMVLWCYGGYGLVHCCPLSLWYLDAETGYRVATPYTRVLEINEALGAKVDQSGSFFLQNVFFICMTKL